MTFFFKSIAWEHKLLAGGKKEQIFIDLWFALSAPTDWIIDENENLQICT